MTQYRAYLAGDKSSPKRSGSVHRVRRKTPEEDLHRQCVQWVELMAHAHPILAWMLHVPNGGKRPHGEAGKLKAMGAKPGFPDLFLPKVCSGFTGLAIELKSPTGRLSEAQGLWLGELKGEGYLCAVCRSFDEFEAVIHQYLNVKSKWINYRKTI
nr:VRR-NUC domain-containing protein [Rhodoferax antarcticus]